MISFTVKHRVEYVLLRRYTYANMYAHELVSITRRRSYPPRINAESTDPLQKYLELFQVNQEPSNSIPVLRQHVLVADSCGLWRANSTVAIRWSIYTRRTSYFPTQLHRKRITTRQP